MFAGLYEIITVPRISGKVLSLKTHKQSTLINPWAVKVNHHDTQCYYVANIAYTIFYILL